MDLEYYICHAYQEQDFMPDEKRKNAKNQLICIGLLPGRTPVNT